MRCNNACAQFKRANFSLILPIANRQIDTFICQPQFEALTEISTCKKCACVMVIQI